VKRRAIAFVVVALSAAPAPARADAQDLLVPVLAAAAGGMGAINVGFTARDAVLYAGQARLTQGYAIAETAVMTPVAAVWTAATIRVAYEKRPHSLALDILVPITDAWSTWLAVHGMWSVAYPNASQGVTFLASMAIGANTAVNVDMLGNFVSGRFPVSRPVAVTQILLSVPGVAVPIWEVSRLNGNAGLPPLWAGLLVWSSLDLGYDMFSLIAYEAPKAPPAPRTMRVSPIVVGAGRASGPGLAVAGIF
jgi:hypothetical protein